MCSLLLSRAGTLYLCFFFFLHTSSSLPKQKCLSVSGAVCMPGSSAVCTSSYCQALLYPCLAHHTQHQFWVTVISLDRRDDLDASSHPTWHATCFRQHKMPVEPICRPENYFWEHTALTRHSLDEVDERGSSLSIQTTCPQCILLGSHSEINHLNDDNMMQYWSASNYTQWVSILRPPPLLCTPD